MTEAKKENSVALVLDASGKPLDGKHFDSFYSKGILFCGFSYLTQRHYWHGNELIDILQYYFLFFGFGYAGKK